MPHLDQHFIINQELINTIIKHLNIQPTDHILEIGPGKCAFTIPILEQTPKSLISIEKDPNFKPHLETLKQKHQSFNYQIKNGLNEIKYHQFNKFFSAIPYSITENLYTQLLNIQPQEIHIIHGYQFYKTITQRQQSKWHYLINGIYNIKQEIIIKGNNFQPPTKTKSIYLKLEKKETPNILIKFILKHYNKSVKNLIIKYLEQFNKKKTSKTLYQKLNINQEFSSQLTKKLSNKDFLNLINIIKYIKEKCVCE